MEACDVETSLRTLLREGEVDAARRLLAGEYEASVASLCRGMVRDPRAAEDLAQDVYVRAIEGLEGYRGEGSLRGWVLRIARNRCLDHLRSGKYAPTLLEGDALERLAPAEADDVSGTIERVQRAELALEVLDPDDRALVLLHHVRGLDYAELAETFGASEGALRMRMQRALVRMRDALEASTTRRPRRSPAARGALWAALAFGLAGVAVLGVYRTVILPQQEQSAALAAQLVELREAEAAKEAELQAALARGASEEELQRLRDQLARAHAAMGLSGDTVAGVDLDGGVPTVRRSRAHAVGAGGAERSRNTCQGPLCGLRGSGP